MGLFNNLAIFTIFFSTKTPTESSVNMLYSMSFHPVQVRPTFARFKFRAAFQISSPEVMSTGCGHHTKKPWKIIFASPTTARATQPYKKKEPRFDPSEWSRGVKIALWKTPTSVCKSAADWSERSVVRTWSISRVESVQQRSVYRRWLPWVKRAPYTNSGEGSLHYACPQNQLQSLVSARSRLPNTTWKSP